LTINPPAKTGLVTAIDKMALHQHNPAMPRALLSRVALFLIVCTPYISYQKAQPHRAIVRKNNDEPRIQVDVNRSHVLPTSGLPSVAENEAARVGKTMVEERCLVRS
jgi:hypothetical protein